MFLIIFASLHVSQLRERTKEVTELRYDNEQKNNEIEKLRREDSSLGGTLDLERRNRQKQFSEMQLKEGEIRSLK